MNTYRHWDVIITKVDALPEWLQKKETLVLVEWDTWHKHKLNTGEFWSNAEWPTIQNKYQIGYVVVPEEWAKLTHEEHDTIELKQGLYLIGIQREYDPIEERRVID